jgi:hypothetical protein
LGTARDVTCPREQFLGGCITGICELGDAEIPQFLIFCGQSLRVEHRIAALAVVVTAEAKARCSAGW